MERRPAMTTNALAMRLLLFVGLATTINHHRMMCVQASSAVPRMPATAGSAIRTLPVVQQQQQPKQPPPTAAAAPKKETAAASSASSSSISAASTTTL